MFAKSVMPSGVLWPEGGVNFKLEAKVMVWMIFGAPVLMAMAAVFVMTWGLAIFPSVFMIFGFYLFFKAKMSEKRRMFEQQRGGGSRVAWISFGSRNMSKEEAKAYWTGYALMTFGVLSAVLLSRGFRG